MLYRDFRFFDLVYSDKFILSVVNLNRIELATDEEIMKSTLNQEEGKLEKIKILKEKQHKENKKSRNPTKLVLFRQEEIW